MNAKTFRFLYRAPGELGWNILPGASYQRNREDAEALVADWNNRDGKKWQWRCEEVLPEDFDHPEQRKNQ